MDNLAKYKEYRTILSVNALIWWGGKVLLLKRSAEKNVDPGFYSGVGGKVEPEEDFYSAILRELNEEIGLTEFKSIRLYGITQHQGTPEEAEWVNISFYVEIEDQISPPKTDDGEFLWIDPKDVGKLKIVEDMGAYVKILSQNPKANILGFFRRDERRNLVKKDIRVF